MQHFGFRSLGAGRQRDRWPICAALCAVLSSCAAACAVDQVVSAEVRPDASVTQEPAPCDLAPSDPRREPLETRCDGIDNDCDGLVDVLVPTGPNACGAGDGASCASGWAYCAGTVRTCAVTAPAPEVKNGLDDDCNGTVDDVVPVSVRPTVLLLIPDYLWTDGMIEILDVTAVLDAWGIPVVRSAPGQFLASATTGLDEYAVVLVPGYLMGGAVDAEVRAGLEDFATAGGVVIVTKPVQDQASDELFGLLGIQASTRLENVESLQFDATAATALRSFDSPEELNPPVGDEEVYVFDAAQGTLSVGHAISGPSSDPSIVGAALVRRAVGEGAVYALGHDLHAFGKTRCYVNCFEPSGDLLALFVRDALREGARGHLVLKHPSADAATSTVMFTNDVDAPDAQNAGSWGEPGALQMADVEKSLGAVGTFFVTTDLVNGYFNPETISSLCDKGMCPLGAHSVRHGHMGEMPPGTCDEAQPEYAHQPPTACGEIVVSQDILSELTGQTVRTWRSPYLETPAALFDVLASRGFVSDSSFGIGDMRSNLPISVAKRGSNQEIFHNQDVITIPVVGEDGKGWYEGGVEKREELQLKNLPWFVSSWTYATLRNAHNGAHTTVLVHPSYGIGGVGPENLANKIEASRLYLQAVQDAHLPVRNVVTVSTFWRAREPIVVEARYDSGSGYTGTITTGPEVALGFTLEFGDDIATFECAACGAVKIDANHVVVESPPQNAILEFTALP